MRTVERRTTVVGALTAAVVIVFGVAALLGVLAFRSNGENPSENTAFIDITATQTVLDEATNAMGIVFTIKPSRVSATKKAAHDALEGRAVAEYEELYGPLLKRAKGAGLRLTTTARAIGVTALGKDSAEVLVLADQSARTAGVQPTIGAAQFSLVLKRHGQHWKIADIKVL